VDETKMMRSRWNEEVDITMQGELLAVSASCSTNEDGADEIDDEEQVLVMG
jgi:hypothetical protein